jgi:hypothetical protein
MEERNCICDPHKATETLQVYLYAPREFIFVGARQGSRLSENGGGGSTEGAASLATKISWPNAMRFFSYWDMLRAVFLSLLPQDLLRRRIIAAISEIDHDMLQRVWVEMGYRLDVCRVANGRHTEHLWGNKITWRPSLSICRSHVTILSAIKVYRFYEMCQGIVNNPFLLFKKLVEPAWIQSSSNSTAKTVTV